MNRDETKKIIRVMMSCYPNYKPSDLSDTIDTWTLMLMGFNYGEVLDALKAFIMSDTSGFAPGIGQIVDMIQKKNDLSESEAWAQVKKCLRDITAPDRDVYSELPDTIKRAIGGKQIALQWSYMDSDKVDTVIASNFKKDYRTELNRSKIDKVMPNYLNRMIEENAPEQVQRIEVRKNGVPMPDGMMEDVKERLSCQKNKY